MQIKSEQVKAAIAACDFWYMKIDCNIRTLTERIEEMWFEVEYHVCAMEQAEKAADAEQADEHLERIIRYIERIKEAVHEVRSSK